MHLWEAWGRIALKLQKSICEEGGIHSSQRESKRAEKKIENRKAVDKRKKDEKHNH